MNKPEIPQARREVIVTPTGDSENPYSIRYKGDEAAGATEDQRDALRFDKVRQFPLETMQHVKETPFHTAEGPSDVQVVMGAGPNSPGKLVTPPPHIRPDQSPPR